MIIPLATAKETKSQVGPSQDNIVNKPESDKPSEEGPTEGFHLSKRDRKKIVQRGQLGKYKKHQIRQSDRSQPGNLKVAPTTSPKQAFKIQAADNEENSLNSLSHIYVGRLSSQENEQKIRVHLHEIGIPLLKVSDVLKLRCKRPRESSFCITINDNSIKDSIYDTANWPAGVIIRAFTPSIQRRSAPAQRSYQNNNRAPGLTMPDRATMVTLHSATQVITGKIITHNSHTWTHVNVNKTNGGIMIALKIYLRTVKSDVPTLSSSMEC